MEKDLKLKKMNKKFSKFATSATKFAGTPWAFIIALVMVGIWAITGPIFGWSQVHSLFINTLTTIITFLMVFIIQHSQNKDTLELHHKIDELIKIINKDNGKTD